MKREEIDAKYLKRHAELEARFYCESPELSEEEFKRLHGELWQEHEEELRAAGLCESIPALQRDLGAEIDDLKQRVGQLEAQGTK